MRLLTLAAPLALLAISAAALAADPPSSPDPAAIYAPFSFGPGPNAFRDGAGAPGPLAWQNHVDTAIAATLDPATHVLRGSETISYRNNSPDSLDVLWVQLDQNIYRPDSRAHVLSPPRDPNNVTTGDTIEAVTVDGRPVPFLVTDTRMQLVLAHPLAPRGGQASIAIAWHHTVPGLWGGRTAITPTQHGDIWEMGQWFPRMCVYDDIRGWDTAPYLGQEFYLEYGDIDYRITVPHDWLVIGSGALMNPDEVLTANERARLARAAGSDRTVAIRTRAEVGDPATRPAGDSPLTWHWRMRNTRDVAFAASPALAWDAAKIDLPPLPDGPNGRKLPRLAMSIYPPEAAPGWDRSTEYVKHAIEYFSAKWYPFPWPNAVNLGGHGAGMEYPAMAFDDMHDTGRDLFWITTHELGHGWFPMIVGSNERRFAFMDEGFNTFIDVYASDHFNHGEYAPKRDPEYAPGAGTPAEQIAPLLADPAAPTLLEPADLVSEKYRHPLTYFKGAFGLTLLRERILGPERFDRAFRRYIATWAYHHPAPEDFFRLMDSEAGEDLSWFWRGWYAENWQANFSLIGVAPVDSDPSHGTAVTVHDDGWLVLPVVLRATQTDGRIVEREVPSEAWMRARDVKLTLPTTGPVRQVALDPDHALPLADRDRTVLAAPFAVPQH